MSMNLETRIGISRDLASLTKYETEKVIEGRLSENHIQLLGSAKRIAEGYLDSAKDRLELIVHGLNTVNNGGASSFIAIKDCIHQLETFITSQQEVANG